MLQPENATDNFSNFALRKIHDKTERKYYFYPFHIMVMVVALPGCLLISTFFEE